MILIGTVDGLSQNWKPPVPTGATVTSAVPSPAPTPSVGPLNPFAMMQGGLLQSAFMPGGFQPTPQAAPSPGIQTFFGASPQPQFGRGSQRTNWR